MSATSPFPAQLAPRARRTYGPSAAWLIALPVSFVSAVFVFPLLYMVRMSFNRSTGGLNFTHAFTAANYTEFLTDRFYLATFGRTFLLAVVVTAITLVLGYPVAYVVARTSPGRRLLLLLFILVAMWIPVVVRIYGTIIAFDDHGPVNDALTKLHLIGTPFHLINTRLGVVVGLVNLTLPWMVLSLLAILYGIDRRLEDAAHNLGASHLRAFFEIVLPLSIPGAVSGTILVFTWSIGEYAVPSLIGGGSMTVMSQLIFDAFFQAANWPLAAAMAVIMFIPVAIVTGGLSRWMHRRY